MIDELRQERNSIYLNSSLAIVLYSFTSPSYDPYSDSRYAVVRTLIKQHVFRLHVPASLHRQHTTIHWTKLELAGFYIFFSSNEAIWDHDSNSSLELLQLEDFPALCFFGIWMKSEKKWLFIS